MSFEITPEELSRVEVAKFLGIKLDPITHVELASISIIGSIYLLDVIPVAFILLNHNYPPLKCKNVPIMAMLYTGGVIWFLGDTFTGGLVHLRSHPVLQCCRFTLIWFRVCFGALYITSIFCLRCFSLYRVFYQMEPFRGNMIYAGIGVVILFISAFGAISMAVPRRLTTQYIEELDVCYVSTEYVIAAISTIWAVWVLTGIMGWRMRNVMFSFNEWSESIACFVTVLVIITLNTVALLGIDVYPANRAWRNALVFINHIGANLMFWTIMGPSAYHCAFHREAYLKSWVDELMADGLERAYGLSSRLYPTRDDMALTSRLIENERGEKGRSSSASGPQVANKRSASDRVSLSGDTRDYNIPTTLSELCLINEMAHT